jgi:heterodisulfide reductase subunit A
LPRPSQLITYIDESCLYLKEKKCRICEALCENKAIDFNQTPKRREVKVGAVILASGFEPYNPS